MIVQYSTCSVNILVKSKSNDTFSSVKLFFLIFIKLFNFTYMIKIFLKNISKGGVVSSYSLPIGTFIV